MMDFLVSSCEQHPMLRDGTVLRSSAVTIGTTSDRTLALPVQRYTTGHRLTLHGIKPLHLNGSFDSKCTRPETSHSYQSFTILINTSTLNETLIPKLKNLFLRNEPISY